MAGSIDRVTQASRRARPIGHLIAIPAFADEMLMGFDRIWAAAGAHDAVFAVEPKAMANAARATIAKLAAA